jgi:hypothetical protein
MRLDLRQRSKIINFNFLMKKKLLVTLIIGIFIITLAFLVWLLLGGEQLFGSQLEQNEISEMLILRQGFPTTFSFSNFSPQITASCTGSDFESVESNPIGWEVQITSKGTGKVV